MTETAATAKLVKELRNLGAMSIKLAGGSMQRGLPDLLVIHCGTVQFLELKMLGNAPTPLQEEVMKQIRAHGGKASVWYLHEQDDFALTAQQILDYGGAEQLAQAVKDAVTQQLDGKEEGR